MARKKTPPEPARATPPGDTAVVPEPPKEYGVPAHSRREFLTRAGEAALWASGAGSAMAAVRFALPDIVASAPERFALGTPADFKVRTVTWLRDRELFVVRDEQGFGAFSVRCTHLGCTVRRTPEGFACPCHGARFDERGRVVSGPARRPLPWFALSLGEDGRIWVDRSRVRAPGTEPLGLA
jgi:cytochrome b6-f complex iron-sulfur subunit